MLKRFRDGDVINNVLETYPKQSFLVWDGSVYSSERFLSSSIPMYSFITKDGTLSAFKTVGTGEFNQFTYGDEITGSSQILFSSSLSRYWYEANDTDRPYVNKTLRNSFDFYKIYSPHYAFDSDLGDKATQEINIISIPSIFCGSSLRKTKVKLDFLVSGSSIATVEDINGNGELIQTGPVGSTGSGSVAGVCFYREGVIALTGSWSLGAFNGDYTNDGAYIEPKWTHFGGGIEADFGSGVLENVAYKIDIEGIQRTPTLTMMCHADRGELNYSNNPTYVVKDSKAPFTSSSFGYVEPRREIVNIAKSDYLDPDAKFKKTTLISKIFIYDEDKNVIGVAKLAKPIKKTEEREYTFKVKVDI